MTGNKAPRQATHIRSIVILPVQLARVEVSNKLLQLTRNPEREGGMCVVVIFMLHA